MFGGRSDNTRPMDGRSDNTHPKLTRRVLSDGRRTSLDILIEYGLFVCGCVYVTKDRERLHCYGHIIYQSMQNYLSSAQQNFEICPPDRPAAIGRKVDAMGKNRSKKAYFSRFLDNLTYLTIPYRLEILNRGRYS